MKKRQFLLFAVLLAAFADCFGQPLMKTHVETGDVEATADGSDLAIYKAIPYAAPPVCAGKSRNPPSLGVECSKPRSSDHGHPNRRGTTAHTPR